MEKRKLFKKNIKFEEEKSIIIKNTCIEVKPYNIGDAPALERSLCVWNDIYYRVEMIGMDYNAKTKTLFVPRSTNVSKLENIMGVEAKKMTKCDASERVCIGLNYGPRDERQIEALNFLLGKGKYFGNTYYSRLMLSLDTNGGKTYCAIAAISEMKSKAAIILPDDALIKGWIEGIDKLTDLNIQEDITIIKGKSSINDILEDVVIDKSSIVLMSHRTIHNYGDKYGWSKIGKLFRKLKIGIKVIDEAHKEFRNTVKIDLHTNTNKTIYLTATAVRSAMKENKIYKNVLLSLPQLVINNERREENYIDMIILQYDSGPTMKDVFTCKTKKGFSSTAFMKYNMRRSTFFFSALDVFIKSVKDKDGKILIMVGLIDMIYMVKDYIEEAYPELSGDVGTYCSKVSPEEKEYNLKNKKVIVSTFKSLGTGVDMQDLKFICQAEPYSSEGMAKQGCGRLRQSGWYFEIVDTGFKDCKRQFERRKDHLIRKARKFKIINM